MVVLIYDLYPTGTSSDVCMLVVWVIGPSTLDRPTQETGNFDPAHPPWQLRNDTRNGLCT